MKKLALYYGFIITAVMALLGFLNAQTPAQLISASLFYPLAVYYLLQVIPRKRKALKIPTLKPSADSADIENDGDRPIEAEIVDGDEPVKLKRDLASELADMDPDRRAFIKLIGSAGVSVFLFSIFTKKAHAAFFGSVPGPGTVAIKDSSGNQIDPAIKHPTDGFRVNQIDDTSDSPNTYFGFTEKNGAWFIIKDNGSGDYRYHYGASDFTNVTTGWPNRTALTYDYYDNVF